MNSSCPIHGVLILAGLVLLTGFPGVQASETDAPPSEPSFHQHVRPVLSNHCFHCHGPDESDREADVRLDVPDHVDLDEVVARITSPDADYRMPPPDAHRDLSLEQVTILQQWIAAGGKYEKHWSFEPPRAYQPPTSQQATWRDQEIDRFVLARLEREGLRSNPQADRRTLIRRVTFDLTGLPPTLEEIQVFLDDASDHAYEHLVDRLLAKPQYGEHMTRYWLDLVRFADTNGLHHDHYREMTPYRDWVIRAFNDNLAYDQFVTYQIAGDLYPRPSQDQLIASGFHRLHLIIDRGTALPEESLHRNVVDRVSAVGTAFLGLTLQCAVCHDHKYDPITQRDFYQFYAFFNNFDGDPETGGRGSTDFRRGLQSPYIDLPTPEQAKTLKRFNGEIEQLRTRLKALKAQHKAIEEAAAQGRGPNQGLANGPSAREVFTSASNQPLGREDRVAADNEIKRLTDEIEKQVAARDAHLTTIPATLVMKERAEVRPTYVLLRGAYDQPGEPVERNTPSFLPPIIREEAPRTRMDLAEWLVASSHPLTARVAANRFWQQFFGVGLVKTAEDFGAQGEVPSHPGLLDHLAIRFMESHWDIKALVRTIVLSKTYRQSSSASPDQFVADPDNRLLARGPRFRLDAEVIRDQILAMSGLLNPTMYGKSVKPPQPPGLWKAVSMPSSYPQAFQADAGSQIYRRSLYTYWKRAFAPPQMTIFDAPARESCAARRERTNTPLQALLLMNEEQYFSAAMHYASTLLGLAAVPDSEKIHRAYETITSHVPSDATVAQLTRALHDFRRTYREDQDSAREMIEGSGDTEWHAIQDAKQQIELASWTMLVHSLFNLDVTRTRE